MSQRKAGETTERLKNEVTDEQSAERAIVALNRLTEEIVSRPGNLWDEDLDAFRNSIESAFKRVQGINKKCLGRVVSKHGFQGDPGDWVDAVLSLRIFKKTNVA